MTHPPGCADLACLLTRLRMELRAEAPSKLHTHAAPVLRDHEGIATLTDEGGIGVPFTAAFHRYLGHSDGWGLSRIGMLSILEVSDACASRHPNHRRPLFTKTVCGQLLFEAAKLNQDVADLAWLHREPIELTAMPALSMEQIVGMLTWGLQHAEQWRSEKFAQWSKVPGEDAPLPERRPYRPAGRAA